jgi:hypothetical protein
MMCDVDIPEGAGDFRLFDRRVVDAINSLPERNRFMKGITSWVGFRQEEIEFEVAERAAGVSSFSFVRCCATPSTGCRAFPWCRCGSGRWPASGSRCCPRSTASI